MVCAACGVYEGDPTCGACRAVSRITGLLRSGHLVSDQKKVTEVLRGAEGELSDLAEQRTSKGSAGGSLDTQEGIQGLTSGPGDVPANKPGTVAEKKKNTSEYSYVEDEEEEESASDKVEEDPDEGGGRYKEERERPGASGAPEPETGHHAKGVPVLGSSDRRVDPHYLSKALQLKPVPKPHSGKESRRRSARSDEEDHRDAGRPGAGRPAPDGRATGSTAGQDEEDSQGRAPLPRRKVKRTRDQGRGTKGVKKRERSKKFRQDKIDQRRREKRDREWRQRQKQKQGQWPRYDRGQKRWRS